MNTQLKQVLVTSVVLAALALTAAQAQAEPRPEGPNLSGAYISDGPQLEIFVSSFGSDLARAEFIGGNHEVQLGLRGALHLTHRFALEGSLCRFENYDAWMGDVSAKYYLKNRGRVAVYAVGGPGLIFGSDVSGDEMTVHLGVGLEFPIGNHLFVRPEVRGMALAKDLDTADTVFSLGVGWRL